MMTNVTFSKHALEERIERITYISTTIGFGEVCYKREGDNNTMSELTSTGVMFVRDISTDKIVTVCIATMINALWIARYNLSPAVRNKVRKNTQRGYQQIAQSIKR